MIKKPKKYPCPTCQKMTEYSLQNEFRPFCCERCKIADTAAWATENYKIPSQTPPDSEREDFGEDEIENSN